MNNNIPPIAINVTEEYMKKNEPTKICFCSNNDKSSTKNDNSDDNNAKANQYDDEYNSSIEKEQIFDETLERISLYSAKNDIQRILNQSMDLYLFEEKDINEVDGLDNNYLSYENDEKRDIKKTKKSIIFKASPKDEEITKSSSSEEGRQRKNTKKVQFKDFGGNYNSNGLSLIFEKNTKKDEIFQSKVFGEKERFDDQRIIEDIIGNHNLKCEVNMNNVELNFDSDDMGFLFNDIEGISSFWKENKNSKIFIIEKVPKKKKGRKPLSSKNINNSMPINDSNLNINTIDNNDNDNGGNNNSLNNNCDSSRTKSREDIENLIIKIKTSFIKMIIDFLNKICGYEEKINKSKFDVHIVKLNKKITGQIEMEKTKDYLFNRTFAYLLQNEEMNVKISRLNPNKNLKIVDHLFKEKRKFSTQILNYSLYDLYLMFIEDRKPKLEGMENDSNICEIIEEKFITLSKFCQELEKKEGKEYADLFKEKAKKYFLNYYKKRKGRNKRKKEKIK